MEVKTHTFSGSVRGSLRLDATAFGGKELTESAGTPHERRHRRHRGFRGRTVDRLRRQRSLRAASPGMPGTNAGRRVSISDFNKKTHAPTLHYVHSRVWHLHKYEILRYLLRMRVDLTDVADWLLPGNAACPAHGVDSLRCPTLVVTPTFFLPFQRLSLNG